MNTQNLITVQELAKILNVPESWVRRQVFIKNVPFIKVGHYIRFNKDEIQNWLHEKTQNKSALTSKGV